MNDYLEAKANLFRHQKPEDIAIYYAKNEYSKKIAGYSAGKKVPYCEAPGAYVRDDGMIVIGKTEVIDKTDVKLIGEHNLQNICAALTAVFEATGSLDGAKEVLSNFSGLEHRLELVRELGGIRYYDDSFAATPDAGTAAIRAIPGNKVMIMGGFDRQLPLEEFASDIKSQTENIRKIVLVGQSAKRVAQQLGELGFNNFMISDDKEMSAILSQATEFAKPGDAVVLSPGFASFDMFKNFEVRGREFKKAVMSL
jgi:UDP-N-acetylmuramoylalanine--D-glutamate ligase